ncbi:MAG: dehydrogenase [Candidatus Eisenbacteria bacterium]|uniref:Dehydrogenase n=1 Tax=Eiseniibacteriota bacterium TaxID=2212470 RepID=A0A538THH0_UNCEI|nr:MAG: dehydrogenase [Candidatus Eisenbacteria bacterium]
MAATRTTTSPSARFHGLTAQELVGLYRTMVTSRRLDDEEIRLKKLNLTFFQISGAGHEAVLAAAGKLLQGGYDWFYPYYRDRALCLQIGMTPKEMLLSAVASREDPNSGGRQMPSHWGHKKLNIVSQSSPTGTQFLQAVGAAEALVKYKDLEEEHPELRGRARGDEVVLVTTGDGATSEGEFWEAMNTASCLKLPVLFLCEDNGYAISVPVDVQTAGGNVSTLVKNFPNLFWVGEINGNDPVESYGVLKEAIAHCRARKGPAFVRALVTRPYSHSMSDDETKYKRKAERDAETQRDCLTNYARFLIDEGFLTETSLKKLHDDVQAEIRRASDEAQPSEQPPPEQAMRFVYSEDVDPTSERFAVEPRVDPSQQPETLLQLINYCLRDEMKRDPRIVVFGEDVADASHEEALGETKGKGGVFGVTWGLQKLYGGTRVYNSPLAEANIVGRAIGLATLGLRPVVEVQFFDYIWPAMMQIRNELSNLRWRSNNAFAAPVIIRTAYGGYLQGGAPYHSQCGESIFAHCPGLRVVLPSTAIDANGLLRTALRCEDPVLFLEHKHLYRQPYAKSPYPGPDYTVPFGKARLVRAGSDVTVVTYGALVQRSFLAAQEAADQGVEAEILDLRTLQPLDFESVARSVEKTGRVIVAHEDTMFCGYGAEVAAKIASECFMDLDAPVKRVAALDCMVAYAPTSEEKILPQKDDMLRAILEVARF